MKYFAFLVLILVFSCVETPLLEAENIIQNIEEELVGSSLNDTLKINQRAVIEKKITSKIYYKSRNKLIDEIDIHLHSNEENLYSTLVDLYNQEFNSTKKDSIFNSWRTDSSEFMLYKNSDSSILVNIFKRTYL
ncbi:MAG: hypothetical protein ABF242_01295 [Flavobacteriales bacterium]